MSLVWNLSAVHSFGRSLGLCILLLFIPNLPSSEAAYPRSELEAVETDRERQIRELREAEISQIRVTLGRRLPKNRRADLYFRLAELYFEAYQAEFLREGRVHENRLNSGKKVKRMDRGSSKKILRKGLRACEDLVRLKISYAKLDRVYYFLAFNHKELGNRNKGLGYYRQMIKRFPKSQFLIEAYRELGEDSFKRRRYKEAAGMFEKALVQRDRSGKLKVPGILHKLAWSYYRTRQFDKAVDTMKRAIKEALDEGEKFLSIREEALRDMAIFMTERGQVEEAISYFRRVAGDQDYYPETLRRLAKEYQRRVQPDRATTVYEALLRATTDEELRLETLYELVRMDLKAKRLDKALDRVRSAEIESEYDTESAKQTRKNLKASFRRTATGEHDGVRKSRKGKKRADRQRRIEAYYEVYISKFLDPDDDEAELVEIQMYLAETKRDLAKLDEASSLYRKVLKSDAEKHHAQAVVLLVGTLEEALKGQKAGNTISRREKEFIEAADDLEEISPGSKPSREAALKAAQILAAYPDQEKETISRVKLIVAKWPKSWQGIRAAQLWLQVQEDRLPDLKKAKVDDYRDRAEGLSDSVARLRENDELIKFDRQKNRSRLKKKLDALATSLRVGAIAAFEKEKDFKAAGEAYESYADGSKSRSEAEKAFGNAVSSYLLSESSEAVVRVAQKWFSRYPRSKKSIRAARSAATTLLIEGKFEDSAQLFKKLGLEGGDALSLNTAARLFEGVEI